MIWCLLNKEAVFNYKMKTSWPSDFFSSFSIPPSAAPTGDYVIGTIGRPCVVTVGGKRETQTVTWAARDRLRSLGSETFFSFFCNKTLLLFLHHGGFWHATLDLQSPLPVFVSNKQKKSFLVSMRINPIARGDIPKYKLTAYKCQDGSHGRSGATSFGCVVNIRHDLIERLSRDNELNLFVPLLYI